jgi:hypothetical protein
MAEILQNFQRSARVQEIETIGCGGFVLYQYYLRRAPRIGWITR